MNLLYLKRFLSFHIRKYKSIKKSYSQTGIDLVLKYIFKNQKTGFFIDIGCNHPVYNNNTYLLHRKGWVGLNIDLDEECIKLFNQFRPDDINVNCAVSSINTNKDVYFYHNKSPINTLEKIYSEKHSTKVKEIKKINALTLDTIINDNHLTDKQIDFLSIDVEGHELDVLKGFNIKKYNPKVIIVEFLDIKIKHLEIKNLDINKILSSELYNFLLLHNYSLVNWLHSDLIFVNKNFRD
jgi:FkbM family methyltransferase